MKKKLLIITCTSAASLWAFATVAQESPRSIDGTTTYPDQSMTHGSWSNRLGPTKKASDLMGLEVKNYQNETLGKVSDLAVNVETGRIVYVIISTGGFMGMGNTLHAVPPGALRCDAANQAIQMDADKAKLDAAPKFEMAKWADCSDTNRVTDVYGYYGQQPYFVGNRDGDAMMTTSDADVRLVQTLPRNMDGTFNTTGGKPTENSRNAEAVRNVAETQNTLTTRNADGSISREYYPNGTRRISSGSSLGYVQSASKLMGAAVVNLQHEKIGKVKNLIVDLSAGRIVAVVVSAGDYLGMANELSAVPPAAFRVNPENKALQLDVSKEALSSAPHFNSGEWPDMSQPGYAGGVYRAYQVEPYFSDNMRSGETNAMSTVRDGNGNTSAWHDPANTSGTNTTYNADNTGRNIRDRNSNTLTPLDQGNSQADINTTAQIRKGIIAVDGMSVNAKNVKIITANGQVTLRGPVDTSDEKRQIGDIASNIAGADNVNNQLEVKMTTSSN